MADLIWGPDPDAPNFSVIPDPLDQPEGMRPSEAAEFKRLLQELAARQIEGLKLYEPLPIINQFHACTKDERLLRGSNRAGKTLGAAVEAARAVTGQDPFNKFPKRDGVGFVIGQNQKHLGGVIFKKLFRPGAFKIIRDEMTNEWRAFRPLADAARAREARPAPPLIPPRMLAEPIAWEDKKMQVPSRAVLTTGWVLQFFASGGQPPNGVDIDLFWIDEEIDNEAWYSELVARLLDRKGKMFWSATPQVASDSLYALHERAEREPPDPMVAEFLVLLTDNPHIDTEEKEKLLIRLSDEDRRVRYYGEYAQAGFRVYPEFDFAKIHAFPADGWQVPNNWARYMAVDPGRQRCAVLFLAVPPPAVGKFAVIYDELYIPNCTAEIFGKEVSEKSKGFLWEAMLIDNHAARIAEMGSGITVEYQYTQALKRYRVSTRNGCGFLAGSDNPKAGIEKVRDWLRIRPDGTSYLRVATGRCSNLRWETQRYHYKRERRLGTWVVTDEPVKRNDHLMDCLRYLAMYGPVWRMPKLSEKGKSSAVLAIEAKRKRQREKKNHAVPI